MPTYTIELIICTQKWSTSGHCGVLRPLLTTLICSGGGSQTLLLDVGVIYRCSDGGVGGEYIISYFSQLQKLKTKVPNLVFVGYGNRMSGTCFSPCRSVSWALTVLFFLWFWTWLDSDSLFCWQFFQSILSLSKGCRIALSLILFGLLHIFKNKINFHFELCRWNLFTYFSFYCKASTIDIIDNWTRHTFLLDLHLRYFYTCVTWIYTCVTSVFTLALLVIKVSFITNFI